MPKLVLVWNEIPEEVKLYLLDTNSIAATLALESAGVYINVDHLEDDAPIMKLCDMLENGELDEFEITNSKVHDVDIQDVVECGMYL